MPLQIIRNDITRVKADAIVNTANPKPVVGAGTDSAVYQAAGREEMLAAREKIGRIAPGQAAVTPAFALKAKYVIHTVGPVWEGGTCGEREILSSCYANSLALAKSLGCRSVAFPLISAGTYGFPDGEALNVALESIQRFLVDTDEDMQVTLVVFGSYATVLSSRISASVAEYIDEAEVCRLREAEYGRYGSDLREQELRRRRRAKQVRPHTVEETPVCFNDALSADEDAAAPTLASLPEGEAPAPASAAARPLKTAGTSPGAAKASFRPSAAKAASSSAGPKGSALDDYLPKGEDSFTQRLLRLINESGKENKEIYTAANMSRKVFSAIFSRKNYHPSKNTVLALCLALKLDRTAADDLMARAGYAFSPADTTDCVVRCFMDRKEFSVFEVNFVLYDMDLPLLGSYGKASA